MTLSDGEVVGGLDSWRRFADALPEEDRARFAQLIQTCSRYFPAIQARDSAFPDEALIMCLLLAQRKAIVWLTGLANSRVREDARLDT